MQAIVIDDSRAMRSMLRRPLADAGFDVREAADGKLGLESLALEPRPDLVLVDWNMPNMTGLEFIKAARADPRWASVPIVMVTTENEMHQLELALAAGASEYIMKPFTPESVWEKIALLGFERSAA